MWKSGCPAGNLFGKHGWLETGDQVQTIRDCNLELVGPDGIKSNSLLLVLEADDGSAPICMPLFGSCFQNVERTDDDIVPMNLLPELGSASFKFFVDANMHTAISYSGLPKKFKATLHEGTSCATRSAEIWNPYQEGTESCDLEPN